MCRRYINGLPGAIQNNMFNLFPFHNKMWRFYWQRAEMVVDTDPRAEISKTTVSTYLWGFVCFVLNR